MPSSLAAWPCRRGRFRCRTTPTPAAAVALTIGNGQSTTYGGLLTGLSAITKVGLDKLTLTGANNYAGQTQLTRGAIELGVNAQSPILSRRAA